MGLECLPGRTVIKLEDLGFGDELLKNIHKDSGESSAELTNSHKIEENTFNAYPYEGGGGMLGGGNGMGSAIENRGEVEDVDGDVGNKDTDGSGSRQVEDELSDEEVLQPENIERKRAMRPRRSHMNFQAQKDESCKVCVCSVEGKDEYCSRRPAMNVNECLRMADIMENYQQHVPYNMENVLAYRIRRGQGGSAYKNPGLSSTDDS